MRDTSNKLQSGEVARYEGPASIGAYWGVLLAWGLAVVLVPEYDYASNGALWASGLALSCGLLTPIAMAAYRWPERLLRLEYLLLFGVFVWLVLDLVQGAYSLWGVSRSAVVGSINAISLFAFSMLLGSSLAAEWCRSQPRLSGAILGPRLLFRLICVCFVLALLKVFLVCRMMPACMVGGILAGRFQAPWQLIDIPYLDTLLLWLQLMGTALLPLTMALRHLEKRLSLPVVVSVVFCVLYGLVLFQSGDRRYLGLMVGAGMIAWFVLNPPKNIRNFFVLGVAALILIGLMNTMVSIRDIGIAQNVQQAGRQADEARKSLVRVDANFRFLSYVVDIVPAKFPHTGWRGVYVDLAAPIPRSVLPDKPRLHAFPLRWFVPDLPSSPAWSWTCSAVCEFYLIGGYPIVMIGGLLFGFSANIISRALRSDAGPAAAVLYSMVGMSLFIGLRALREVVILAIVVTILWILLAIAGAVFNKHAEYGTD